MAKCCTSPGCKCTVTAGPGVTVDGNGSPSRPYIVSAEGGGTTALAVTDSETINFDLTGTGTPGDPYEITGSVILDPAPPGGGSNLLNEGPDGLFVECADVRTCFSATDGATYDPATGEIGAKVSTDAGNQTTIGGDGGLYTPASSTAVEAKDSPTVDVTVSGTGAVGDPYEVSAAVILDPAPPGGGTNLIGEGPDGLYVECADVRQCFSAGDGAAYDPATGEIAARPSTDAGNTIAFGADGGLYSAGGEGGAPSVVTAGDTNTADNTVSGTGSAADPYVVTTDVILDPAPPGGGSNLAKAGPDGLYVECADVRQCFSAGDGAAYDPATGEIRVRISGDAGNTTTIGGDGGIYTPAAATALEAADTSTVDVTVTGTGTAGDPYQVAAAVILDPTPPGGGTNLIGEGPDGLYVECGDVRQCFSAGDGAAYDPATGEFSARLSADAGNTMAFGSDGGLYATGGGTSTPTALQSRDTSTVDTTVTGTGTAADPYVVEADVIVAPDPNGLEATAQGLLVAPSSDTGNRLAMGGDGRLFVPPVPPPEVGCGLKGDGTTASPLAANPAAGMDPWASHWTCDATQYSTLRCDPNTGYLWTPPEHYTADDYLYQEHMNPSIASMGPTSGWVALQPGGVVAYVQWAIPANFLGNQCRDWGYQGHVHASIDITANATATFELGYILQVDGATVGARPIEAVYTAYGASRRERYAGSVSHAAYRLGRNTARNVVFFPAVNVTAGNIAINSWISDAALHTATRD
ncbi:hypothetical protein ACFY0A_37415 [Streptomyces sp. NPDC001698]|uniref:hypothetical protein n=1 Tax=Streptomyces sp. NPDC001698 TaxID=3364601 RepID=UPI0036B9303C